MYGPQGQYPQQVAPPPGGYGYGPAYGQQVPPQNPAGYGPPGQYSQQHYNPPPGMSDTIYVIMNDMLIDE